MMIKVWNRPGWAAGCVLALWVGITLGGCGQNTEPTFQAGGGANPLDGGVIDTGGRTTQMDLNGDGTALKTVTVNGAGGGSSIEFGDPVDGMIVPREITTDGGESSLSINRDTEEITFEASVPIVGHVTFGGPLPEDLDATHNILFPRGTSQTVEATCDLIVDSVDEFCNRYNFNRDASLEEVTGFAIEIGQEAIGSNIGNSIITNLVASYYRVLDNFCDDFQGMSVDYCAGAR